MSPDFESKGRGGSSEAPAREAILNRPNSNPLECGPFPSAAVAQRRVALRNSSFGVVVPILHVMEFIFIRHGEPEWSIDGISQVDPGLTARGQGQSRLVAEFLAGEDRPITEILVSPAQRAEQTAAPLVRATGLRPMVVEDLGEIRMPDWSTTPEDEVQAQFREAQKRHPDDWWAGMPGGEAYSDFHKRIAAAMADIAAERGAVALEGGDRHLWHFTGNPDQRIAVVAHAGTNTAALGTLLHIEPTPWEWDRFALGHASISRTRLIPLGGKHVFSLRALNDRVHLPRELRSR